MKMENLKCDDCQNEILTDGKCWDGAYMVNDHGDRITTGYDVKTAWSDSYEDGDPEKLCVKCAKLRGFVQD